MNSKKGRIIIAVIGAVLLIAAIIFVVMNRGDSAEPDEQPGAASDVSIVGTWYSDKPDTLTFTDAGEYQGGAWNGGNPWLLSGSYTVSGSSVTLTGTLDGNTTLSLVIAADGSRRLVGAYTYYETEAAAQAAIDAAQQQQGEEEENVVQNTIDILLGEWISLDETTTCTFTETSFVVHFKGDEYTPEQSLYYEYEVLGDRQMSVTEDGRTAVYEYSLYQQGETWYLLSPVKAFASTYTKSPVSTSPADTSAGASAVNEGGGSTIISALENPDMSDYTNELAEVVDAALIGTWKGTYDDPVTTRTVYWRFEFTADGHYTFFNGDTGEEETGTYKTTHDPNDNYYHSALILTANNEERIVRFYFSGDDLLHMKTDDQTAPVYVKE